jgi:hypothetical protein
MNRTCLIGIISDSAAFLEANCANKPPSLALSSSKPPSSTSLPIQELIFYRIFNGCKSVSNHDWCSFLHYILKSDFDLSVKTSLRYIRLNVASSRIRIWGFSDYCSCNSYSLFLTSRKLASLNSTLNIISVMKIEIFLVIASII